ncbi:2,3-bisphosphoglycerate-independent phosphoglycerate mutase [Luteithermobacter gelatinilyticus]|uniref:2,3-bisphosphoglycerate-independent phosphoglycerate mutase n=1 Tax=Luteithermobacter gelatinilyticus TaxID=2582913 RepID=UPI0011071D0E|nr:2,3-bisphosphoglycerate-independent phosphoglycerate mutase [Luteithermobacter gelatinilyticus]
MNNATVTPTKPVVLCILDGWGERSETVNNAIALAQTPTYDDFVQTCPRGFLETSGMAVGLPDGQMGNSEVGHMNLGGGRVVLQDLPRIDTCIAEGRLAQLPVFRDFVQKLKNSGGVCHLMGLLSPGGVHSHQDHMLALARALEDSGITVAIHGFLDGRDVPPKSAGEFVAAFEKALSALKNARLVTLSGRYYAMDRDKRWERVKLAYEAMAEARGDQAATAQEAIANSYAAGITDEFVRPVIIGDYQGMKNGDGLLMANFRADRAREILTAFLDPAFDGFERDRQVHFAAQAGMVEYSAALNNFLPALFPAEEIRDTLGEVVAQRGLKQLRIAETEKYAHVTFFFNGGSEEVYEGEDRILIPSPDVATYDLKPEMSAPEVTEKLVQAIREKAYDLIVVNYANPDMVGHTGVLPAAIKAVETIDQCLGRLREALVEVGGTMLVTADHGNIEMMEDPQTGQPHTAHTTNLVPFLLVNAQAALGEKAQELSIELDNGRLADVAPTVLTLMGLEQPTAMTGRSLIRLIQKHQQTEVRATA